MRTLALKKSLYKSKVVPKKNSPGPGGKLANCRSGPEVLGYGLLSVTATAIAAVVEELHSTGEVSGSRLVSSYPDPFLDRT